MAIVKKLNKSQSKIPVNFNRDFFVSFYYYYLLLQYIIGENI